MPLGFVDGYDKRNDMITVLYFVSVQCLMTR